MFDKLYRFIKKSSSAPDSMGYWLDAPGTKPNDLGVERQSYLLFSPKEQSFVDKKIWTSSKAAKRLLMQTSEKHYVNFDMFEHSAYGIPQSQLLEHVGKRFYSGLATLDLWRKAERPFNGMPDGNALVFIKIKTEISISGFVLYRHAGSWLRSQAFAFMSDDGAREIDNLFSQWKLSETTEIITIDLENLFPFAKNVSFYEQRASGRSLFEDIDQLKTLPITYIMLGLIVMPTAYYSVKSYQAYIDSETLNTRIVQAIKKQSALKAQLDETIQHKLLHVSSRLDIDALFLLERIEGIYLKRDKVSLVATEQAAQYDISGFWIESNKPLASENYVDQFFGRKLDGCGVKKTTTGDASKITISINCQGNPHPLHRIAHF